MERLEELCRERGLRLTEQRRIVLEVLDAATDHPCTFEIHRRASVERRIGVATVYRALNSLATAGLVTRHVFRDGKARYERTGSAPSRCRRCRRTSRARASRSSCPSSSS